MPTARATACANIALAKYWGKSDEILNVPAVPSVSVTLDALVTETVVTPDASLARDEVLLDGATASAGEVARIVALLDDVRSRGATAAFARVDSRNLFPTASGLASSASGFAALAGAACAAYGVEASAAQVSALARRASASAARSVFGGFVELPAGGPGDGELAARELASPAHWDIAVVIALATAGRKKTGSRDGMIETAKTSPYYPAWLGAAPGYAHEVREGILSKDLTRTGRAMEASTYAMHASAWAARPAVRYARAATMTLLDTVDTLRGSGAVECYATMDAGPHVKVLCLARDAERVATSLRETGAAVDVRIARPGPALRVETGAR